MNKKLLTIACASLLLFAGNNVIAAEGESVLNNQPAQNDMPMPPKHRKMKSGMHTDQLAKELDLTAEQKEKAEALRKADFEKMKPLIEQMKELHKKMDELRKENMKNFEAILTPLQKAKLDGIMLERKKQMEHFRKDFQNKKRPNASFPPMDEHFPPKPMPEE
ncbi:MAG: hypothetical protein MR368_03210 [Azospirillum sp.]|nr:hypothetical protein [Azospirillum sp.]